VKLKIKPSKIRLWLKLDEWVMEHVINVSMIFICLETNTNGAMLRLYLRHDFYNLIFKMKHTHIYIYISSRSAPPPPIKIVVAHWWPVSGRRIESGPFTDELRMLTAGQRPSARSQSSSSYPLDGSCGTRHWRMNFQWYGKRFLSVVLTACNFTARAALKWD